jgi:hypothetical protein
MLLWDCLNVFSRLYVNSLLIIVLIRVSILYHSGLYLSFKFCLWKRSSYSLNLKHFSNLICWFFYFILVEIRLWFFFSQVSSFLFILFIFLICQERNTVTWSLQWDWLSCGELLIFFVFSKVFLLNFIHINLCFFNWIN